MQRAAARLQQRPAEGRFRRAERDSGKAPAAGISEVGAHMVLADDPGIAHTRRRNRKNRLGIAAAEGSDGRQMLQQAARSARDGKARIDVERRRVPSRRHQRRQPLGQERLEGRLLGDIEREAGRHVVAAASLQQPRVPGGEHCRADGHAGDRPRRAAHLPPLPGAHQSRAAEPLHQAARNDADDARMPVVADRECEGRAFLRLHCERGGQHIRLHLPAFPVELFQRLGEAPRLSGVVRGKQPCAEPRLADAPACIDPGAEHETQMEGVRLPLDAGGGEQGRDSGICPPRHHIQAARDEGPVEAGELHHIRDRAERHHVQPLAQVRLRAEPVMAAPAERAVGGDDEQEDDPDRRKAAERAGLVHAVGIDHGERFRKAGLRQMVVEDDAFEADAGGMGERREGGGAAIDRQHEPVPFFRETVECSLARAVSFRQPVGHVDSGAASGRAEEPGKQRRRGRAIDIVVGEYGNGLAGFHSVGQPLRREVHVPEARRVRQRGLQPRLEKSGRRLRRHAPVGEHARGDIREALPLRNRRRRPLIAAPLAPDPALERAGNAQERLRHPRRRNRSSGRNCARPRRCARSRSWSA